MSITGELARHLEDLNPEEFASIPNAIQYQDRTPAHRFFTVIVPTSDKRHFVVLPARDFFDEHLATEVLLFALKREDSLSLGQPVRVLEEFVASGYSFDSVAVLSPSCAKQFEHQNEFLNERSFVTFPMYRCELTGDESAELVDLIRHEFLPSLDWKRVVCPKISMSFNNKSTRVKSSQKKVGLATLSSVLTEIENLFEAEKSWVRLENFLHQRCEVVWNGERFEVKLDHGSVEFDTKAVIDFVKKFAMRGLDKS
jgi:hypothetical protein